jgi:Flp pilus assembly protein TadG
MVEFALTVPVFLLLVWGIIAGAWYVLEVSAVTNAAREAVSWEMAAENWVSVNGAPEPYCLDAGSTVPSALRAAAAATGGPFSGAIANSGTITNVSNTSGTCTVTLTVPYTAITSLVPIGPSTITSSSSAYYR